jgi:hypothetical protein
MNSIDMRFSARTGMGNIGVENVRSEGRRDGNRREF